MSTPPRGYYSHPCGCRDCGERLRYRRIFARQAVERRRLALAYAVVLTLWVVAYLVVQP